MVMVSEVGKYRVHSVGRRIYGTFRKKRRSYSSWSYNSGRLKREVLFAALRFRNERCQGCRFRPEADALEKLIPRWLGLQNMHGPMRVPERPTQMLLVSAWYRVVVEVMFSGPLNPPYANVVARRQTAARKCEGFTLRGLQASFFPLPDTSTHVLRLLGRPFEATRLW